MATVTVWIANNSSSAQRLLTATTVGTSYPARTLIKVTLDNASAEYAWQTAMVGAGTFTRYTDSGGIPVDGSSNPIDQDNWLTPDQYSEDAKGLVEKYQALLLEYAKLYAAADAAEVVLTTFSKPSTYNITYWPIASDPA